MSTLNWKGAWQPTTAYSVGDAISFRGSSYIAVATNTAVTPSGYPDIWNLLAAAGTGTPQGLYWRGTYSTLTAYYMYDCVAYNSASYICVKNGALNLQPDDNPAYWSLLCAGIVGVQGVQGIQGIQGIQGVKGDTGVQGVPGLIGTVSSTTGVIFTDTGDGSQWSMTFAYGVPVYNKIS